MNLKEEIIKELHIEFLSKAKTAIINGDEMTVLPYGHLEEAIGKAIDKVIEECEKCVEDSNVLGLTTATIFVVEEFKSEVLQNINKLKN